MSGPKAIAVVTGGAGLVGSHMVDLLVEEGFRVHVVDSPIAGRELNLAQHQRNPDVVFEKQDMRHLAVHDGLFAGRSTSSTSLLLAISCPPYAVR